MIMHKFSALAGAAAIFTLGACTDPASLSSVTTSNPNQNRNTGLLGGALVGAVAGAAIADTEARGALIGAAVGAAAGGLVGNQLDRQAAELRAQLANDGITVTNAGDRLIITLPEDITFDVDSFSVRPSLQADLQRVAANLLNYPKSNIEVVGHTDNTGDATYNQGLSERRATAVTSVLINNGVPGTRVSTFGQGENNPVATNATPEGRALNRRVDILVLPTT
ncbi:MAG: OmpA family protein [Pseudomonadota bacterium]